MTVVPLWHVSINKEWVCRDGVYKRGLCDSDQQLYLSVD